MVSPDSLQVAKIVHDTVYINGVYGLETLNRVDAFYSAAWTHLMEYIGGIVVVLTLIGCIVIPFLLKLKFRDDMRRMNTYVNNKIERSQRLLTENINQKITEETERLENEINMSINECMGSVFYLQTTSQMDKKEYEDAFYSCTTAMDFYSQATHFVNLKLSLDDMKDCLENLTKEQIQKVCEDKDINFTEFLDTIKERDEKSALQDLFDIVKENYNDIMNNRPPRHKDQDKKD